MKRSFVPNGPGACPRHGPSRSEKGIPQMSRRTSPPFRADHVGSLLRPQRLHRAREDSAAGRIDAAALRAIEDEEITRAVKMQEEVGLQSATDGEFRRASWHMDFIQQLDGVTVVPEEPLTVEFHNEHGDLEATFSGLHVEGKIGLSWTIFGEDFQALASLT